MSKLSYILSILSIFTVGISNLTYSAASPQHHEDDATKKWFVFAKNFRKAFHEGNVTELERLKEEMAEHFPNINDLGGEFMKYGAGQSKWDELIADAHKIAESHKK